MRPPSRAAPAGRSPTLRPPAYRRATGRSDGYPSVADFRRLQSPQSSCKFSIFDEPLLARGMMWSY